MNVGKEIATGETINDIKKDIEELNTNLTAPTVGKFIYDYQDGKHGFNTNPDRGADTFHPFKSDLVIKRIGANAVYTNGSSIGEMHVDCADFSKLKIGSMTTSGSLNYLTWIVTGYVGSTPTTLYNSTAAIANSEYDITSFDMIVFTVYTKGANTTTYGGVYFENVVFSV
jgi:hypothetical protein